MIDCWDQAQVSQEMTSRLEKTILRLWTTSARKRVHIPNRKSIDKLRSLASEMPNFSEVIDFVIEQSQLCLLSASAGFTLPAMLLGGPPGVGKTFFSQRLSAILGFGDVHMIPCGLDNASFGLGGANPTWSSAKPGRPATILLRSQIANPVVLLDEIDKFTKGVVGNGNGGDPYAALYQLLEPTNAKSFIDQYLQFPTNLSLFNWILTANDKDMIPAPIMDRVMYFSIAAPERAHMEKFIVPSVYRTLLAEREMTSAFSDVLSAPVAALLAQCETPRDIRIILLGAFGRAALRATKASIVASDTEFLADGADNETAFIVPTITLEMGDIDIDSRAEAGPSMGFHAVISKPSGRVMLKTI
jgi:ATP-dependent Lon protease